jgi:phosphate transport system substrate-binding protein
MPVPDTYRSFPMPRFLLSAVVVSLFAALVGCGGGGGGGGTAPGGGAFEAAELNGQGATFIEPIMKVWTNFYLDEKTGGKVRIDYQGTASGAGIQQLTKKTTDFACSDAPMNKTQLAEATAAGGPVIHAPLVIGAVVLIYNLEGIDKPLKFTGPALADIYLGKVTKWNDPALKALNPEVALPDLGIQPVFRSDASGTSNIFTEFLSKVSPDFKAKVGASTSPTFPSGVGIGKLKTNGVAGHVSTTKGAIGYVELTYALDKKAQFGLVKNTAGNFVRADLPSITAAAAASLKGKPTEEPYTLHDLTYSFTNADGAESYPIAAPSYALLYAKQHDGVKGRALVGFLKWCVSAEGQKMAVARNYASLPEDLAARVTAKLDTVEIGK